MNKINLLQQQAVLAAKDSDWPKAVTINQEIVNADAHNVGALNRLGLAYLQLKKTTLAKKSFATALQIDSSNCIALKNLGKIKNNQQVSSQTFSPQQFIEEPGITKIVELHRLASKKVIDTLTIGIECKLVTKGKFISVLCGLEYIGSLPDDLSFRLIQLLQRKNEYQVFVYSASCRSVKVFIKEIIKSKKNANITSFPVNKDNLANINDIDEKFLLEEDLPIELVSTDEDREEGEAIESAQKQG